MVSKASNFYQNQQQRPDSEWISVRHYCKQFTVFSNYCSATPSPSLAHDDMITCRVREQEYNQCYTRCVLTYTLLSFLWLSFTSAFLSSCIVSCLISLSHTHTQPSSIFLYIHLDPILYKGIIKQWFWTF